MNTYVELIDKHQGEDCFILAAGPSLFDVFYKDYKDYIELFQDKVVISVNASIMACVEHLDWLTEGDKRYWISDDSLTTRWSWWKLVEQSRCTKIVRNSWLKQNHYGNTNGFLYFAPRTTSEDKIKTEDIGLASTCSTSSALDLAIQLGVKKIFIIGLDHIKIDGNIYFWEYFKKSKQPRQFKPGKPPWRVQQNTYEVNIKEYKMLNRLAKDKHCDIYNCSIQSKVEVFEKIKFKDIKNLL